MFKTYVKNNLNINYVQMKKNKKTIYCLDQNKIEHISISSDIRINIQIVIQTEYKCLLSSIKHLF